MSHDFRHYLAAIYANAEFLASGRLSSKESADIFSEIRTAVLGTTDMIRVAADLQSHWYQHEAFT